MHRMHTLTTLHQQAEEQRDTARAEAQRAASAHQAAQAQLEQLMVYRRDYEARWTQQFQQQGQVALLHCYHGFVSRLSEAVTQQEQAVVHTQNQHAQRLAVLREQELRVASVSKLMARRLAEQRLAGERRDAKHSDELAARMQRLRFARTGF